MRYCRKSSTYMSTGCPKESCHRRQRKTLNGGEMWKSSLSPALQRHVSQRRGRLFLLIVPPAGAFFLFFLLFSERTHFIIHPPRSDGFLLICQQQPELSHWAGIALCTSEQRVTTQRPAVHLLTDHTVSTIERTPRSLQQVSPAQGHRADQGQSQDQGSLLTPTSMFFPLCHRETKTGAYALMLERQRTYSQGLGIEFRMLRREVRNALLLLSKLVLVTKAVCIGYNSSFYFQ